MVNAKFLDVSFLANMDVYNANLVIDYFQMVVVNKVLLKDAMYMHQMVSVRPAENLSILNIQDSVYHLVVLRQIIQENVFNAIKAKVLNLQKKDFVECLIVQFQDKNNVSSARKVILKLEEDVKEQMQNEFVQFVLKIIIFHKMDNVNLDNLDAQTIPYLDAQNAYKIYIFLVIILVSPNNQDVYIKMDHVSIVYSHSKIMEPEDVQFKVAQSQIKKVA